MIKVYYFYPTGQKNIIFESQSLEKGEKVGYQFCDKQTYQVKCHEKRTYKLLQKNEDLLLEGGKNPVNTVFTSP